MLNTQPRQQLMAEARQRYLNGEDTRQIARAFNLSGETIRKQLEKQGVNRRTIADRNQLYSYDPSAFKRANIESAYYAGLLMADGNIDKQMRLFQIELNIKDIYLLESLKRYIGYTGPISIRTRIQKSGSVSQMAALRVTAPDLISNLNTMQGVVPKKSKITDVHVSDVVFHNNLEQFFFRGIFDGDGCVHIRKDGHQYLSLAGHPNIIDAFRDQCWKCIREVGSLSRRSTLSHVVQFGAGIAVRVANLIYSDEKGPRLWRKQNLILL